VDNHPADSHLAVDMEDSADNILAAVDIPVGQADRNHSETVAAADMDSEAVAADILVSV